jgi:hypothetical protein
MKRIHLTPLALSLALAAATPAFAQLAPDVPADFGPLAPADFGPPPPAGAMQPPLENATEPASPPLAAEEAAAHGETRRAGPAQPSPAKKRDADAQTGPYLGHGLFNSRGPDDFGA